MFAVLEEGSKQYLVKVGDTIRTETLNANVGSEYVFSNVLLVGKSGGSSLCYCENKKTMCGLVKGIVLEHAKTDKVIVYKKKRRHNYERKNGHRQNITVVKISEISDKYVNE